MKAKAKTHRPIAAIARDITRTWTHVHYAAAPYLREMHHINTPEDTSIPDSDRLTVVYFLRNAGGWKGPEARRYKTELWAILRASSTDPQDKADKGRTK